MYQALCIVAPGLLASAFYSRLKGSQPGPARIIGGAAIFLVLVNLACLGLIVLYGHEARKIPSDMGRAGFVLKYAALASFLAVCLPLFAWLVSSPPRVEVIAADPVHSPLDLQTGSGRRGRAWIGMALALIVLLVSLTILFSAIWTWDTFGTVTIDQIAFQLVLPLKGVEPEYLRGFVQAAILPPVLIVFLVLLARLGAHGRGLAISAWMFGMEARLSFFPGRLSWKPVLRLSTALLVLSLTFIQLAFKASDYIVSLSRLSTIYETNYIDPATVSFSFPARRRNLVLISMESMESSFLPRGKGGVLDGDYMPELYRLAAENVSFGEAGVVGGAEQLTGTSWSIAGLVARTAGIPLTIPIDGNSYGRFRTFLPGAVTLDEILSARGYTLEFLVGADIGFAGFDNYLASHGNPLVRDYGQCLASGALPKDYRVWWGFEDEKLYGFAREELTRLGSSGEAFALTLLTDDTHATNGYVCRLCTDSYPRQYENVLACASRQVAGFVRWIQDQPWYADTTIVIVGDHLYMDRDFFPASVSMEDRHILDIFINPAVQPASAGRRRFSSLDLFPSVLDSLGIGYDAKGLGLGRSLFKPDARTLLEEMGRDALNAELKKRSKVYDRFLRGS